MPNFNIWDHPEKLEATLDCWLRNGRKTCVVSRKMGISESTVRRHLILARKHPAVRDLEAGVQYEPIIGHSEKFYEPPPPPPKIRVTISTVKSEPGWNGDVLAIGDAHDSPRLNKDRFLWMGRFAAEERVGHIVQIGDIASFDSLCRMEGNDTLRGKEKPPFQDDIDSAHAALTAFDRGLDGYEVSKHITLGNHEDRAISFTNRTPEVAGILTGLVDNLFMSHGWTYSPYGLVHFIGSVGFVHVPLNHLGRAYGGGKTFLQRLANDAIHDLVVGHTHKGGDQSMPKIGTNQRVHIVDCGCALPTGHVEPYVGHSMSGWIYGVRKIRIRDGRIVSAPFYTMDELEEKYG